MRFQEPFSEMVRLRRRDQHIKVRPLTRHAMLQAHLIHKRTIFPFHPVLVSRAFNFVLIG